MLWRLHYINKAWQASISQSLKWQAFEVVKKKRFYWKIVNQLCLKRCSFKEQLQFEMVCLNYCLCTQNLMEPKKQNNF
jgi:hypothetical protein